MMKDDNLLNVVRTSPASKPKVLIVDDEEIIRTMLQKCLMKRGYDVSLAENGLEAVNKLQTEPYDLVITDLIMPVMNGNELLRIMDETFPQIPKIVLTAAGSGEDILHALKTGAYDFIAKPVVDYNLLYLSVSRAIEKKKLNDERNNAFIQLEKVNEVISMLNRGMGIEEIFKMLFVTLGSMMHFNRLILLEMNHDSKFMKLRLSETDINMVIQPGEEIHIDDELFDEISSLKDIIIYDNLSLEMQGRDRIKEELRKTLGGRFNSAAVMPVIIEDNLKGLLLFTSNHFSAYTEAHKVFLNMIAGQIGFSLQRGELLNQLEVHTKNLEHLVKVRSHEVLKTQKTTIFALSKLAEVRDTETGQHLDRIRNYCVLLGQLLKYINIYEEITNDFLRNIYDSSILHDIGKVGIPDAILLKPAALTVNEFEMMKSHTTIGYMALKDASDRLGENSFLQMAMDVAFYHHERWDGKGYPRELSGYEIPLSARIVTIADIYDALTSKRPYKAAITHEKAVQIMREEAYRFDPKLLELFLENHSDFDRIRLQYSQ